MNEKNEILHSSYCNNGCSLLLTKNMLIINKFIQNNNKKTPPYLCVRVAVH